MRLTLDAVLYVLTPDDLEVARFQGRRVAQVAAALKAAGISAIKN